MNGKESCPPGLVAVGVHGRSGDLLDAMGLICDQPKVQGSGNLGKALGALSGVKPGPVKAVGRVKAPVTDERPRPICDLAREARARNSPSAAGLEAQCRAVGEAPAVDLKDLAGRGEAIADADPLSAELRRRQPEGAPRRGFDIGMAAAEGQTAAGPSKQRIHDSLSPEEQRGFDAAVTFSLERNRNLDLASAGAAIAEADPDVAEARNVESDVFYWLGFDIASGIFGDPALGARGNTAPGPGSLAIRDALDAAGKRGFNASMKLHLSRTRQP